MSKRGEPTLRSCMQAVMALSGGREYRYPEIANLEADGFGDWLAGFTDGEGCFLVTSGRGSHRCQFSVLLRGDDKAILMAAAKRTGCGTVGDRVDGHKNPMVLWRVMSKADCFRIVEIFTAFPLRAKKARDFKIWREAVWLLMGVRHLTEGNRFRAGGGSIRHPHQERLARLKTQLSEGRKIA